MKILIAWSKTFDGIAQVMAEQWGNIDNITSKQKELKLELMTKMEETNDKANRSHN